MESKTFIKLSRVRDYGIGRNGCTITLEELETFSPEQLRKLREIFIDEIRDIEYQIKLSEKNCDRDLRWRYSAKTSNEARQAFIVRINALLGEGDINAEAMLAFVKTAKELLTTDVFAKILAEAKAKYPLSFGLAPKKDETDVFTAQDMQ